MNNHEHEPVTYAICGVGSVGTQTKYVATYGERFFLQNFFYVTLHIFCLFCMFYKFPSLLGKQRIFDKKR